MFANFIILLLLLWLVICFIIWIPDFIDNRNQGNWEEVIEFSASSLCCLWVAIYILIIELKFIKKLWWFRKWYEYNKDLQKDNKGLIEWFSEYGNEEQRKIVKNANRNSKMIYTFIAIIVILLIFSLIYTHYYN
jgi:hypothetical protein